MLSMLVAVEPEVLLREDEVHQLGRAIFHHRDLCRAARGKRRPHVVEDVEDVHPGQELTGPLVEDRADLLERSRDRLVPGADPAVPLEAYTGCPHLGEADDDPVNRIFHGQQLAERFRPGFSA